MLIHSILFYGGIVLCTISIISAIIAIFVLKAYKKRLEQILDREYGKEYHIGNQEEL